MIEAKEARPLARPLDWEIYFPVQNDNCSLPLARLHPA
jgi:hypothetical protein